MWMWGCAVPRGAASRWRTGAASQWLANVATWQRGNVGNEPQAAVFVRPRLSDHAAISTTPRRLLRPRRAPAALGFGVVLPGVHAVLL